MRIFLLAVSFLTIIPAYGKRVADDKDMAGSLAYYPLLGFVIGAFLAALAYLGHYLNLGLAGTALVIVFWIVITGGLHLDGLMDTADGMFSGQGRERKLEIMRDSRVGAMGVIALVALLLLKTSFLAALTYPDNLYMLIIAPAFARCMMVISIYLFPYARSGPGLGKSFADQAGWVHISMAAVTLLAGTFWLVRSNGLILLSLSAIPISLIIVWLARQLGGLTGDTYGAICELSETFFLITAVIAGAIMA